MKTVIHIFGPGETIVAIIRKENRMDLHKKEIKYLLEQYNMLNGQVIPRPGSKVHIPILE